VDYLEKLLGDFADKNVREKLAHEAKILALDKAISSDAALKARVDYLEEFIGDFAEKNAKEKHAHEAKIRDLDKVISSAAKNGDDAALAKRVEYLEKFIDDFADKNAKEIHAHEAKIVDLDKAISSVAKHGDDAALRARVDYLEKLLGDFADKHAKEMHPHETRIGGLDEAISSSAKHGDDAALKARVEYLEKFISDFADKHTKEIDAHETRIGDLGKLISSAAKEAATETSFQASGVRSDVPALLDGTDLLDRVDAIAKEVDNARDDICRSVRKDLENDAIAVATKVTDQLRSELLPTRLFSAPKDMNVDDVIVGLLSDDGVKRANGQLSARRASMSVEDVVIMFSKLRKDLQEQIEVSQNSLAQLRVSDQDKQAEQLEVVRQDIVKLTESQKEHASAILESKEDAGAISKVCTGLSDRQAEHSQAILQARGERSVIDGRVNDAVTRINAMKGTLEECSDRWSSLIDRKIVDLREQLFHALSDIDPLRAGLQSLSQRMDVQVATSAGVVASFEGVPEEMRRRAQELRRDVDNTMGEVQSEVDRLKHHVTSELKEFQTSLEDQQLAGKAQLQRFEAASADVAKLSAQLDLRRADDARAITVAAVPQGAPQACVVDIDERLSKLSETWNMKLQQEEASRVAGFAEIAKQMLHAKTVADSCTVVEASVERLCRIHVDSMREQLKIQLQEMSQQRCKEVEDLRYEVGQMLGMIQKQPFVSSSTELDHHTALDEDIADAQRLTADALAHATVRAHGDPQRIGDNSSPSHGNFDIEVRQRPQGASEKFSIAVVDGCSDRKPPSQMTEHAMEAAMAQLTMVVLRMGQLLGVTSEDAQERLDWRSVCAELPRMMEHAWLRSRLPKRASIIKILRHKADAEQVRDLQEVVEKLQQQLPQSGSAEGSEKHGGRNEASLNTPNGRFTASHRDVYESSVEVSPMSEAWWRSKVNSPPVSCGGDQLFSRRGAGLGHAGDEAMDLTCLDVWTNAGKTLYRRPASARRPAEKPKQTLVDQVRSPSYST